MPNFKFRYRLLLVLEKIINLIVQSKSLPVGLWFNKTMTTFFQIVKAFVVLSGNYQTRTDDYKLIEELQEHVRRTTAPYKYPRKVGINIKMCLNKMF